eukprot:47289-Eustigmatos_ZCMA.PRE.1
MDINIAFPTRVHALHNHACDKGNMLLQWRRDTKANDGVPTDLQDHASVTHLHPPRGAGTANACSLLPTTLKACTRSAS